MVAPPSSQVAWLPQLTVRCPVLSWHQSPAILQSHPDLLAACMAAGGKGGGADTLPRAFGAQAGEGLWLVPDLRLPTSPSASHQQGQLRAAVNHQKSLSTEHILGQTPPPFFLQRD